MEEQEAGEPKLMNVRDRERGQLRLNNMGTAVTSKILVSMTERCNVRIKRLKHTIVSYFDTSPQKRPALASSIRSRFGSFKQCIAAENPLKLVRPSKAGQ